MGNIKDIIRTVAVKNRIVDADVTIRFDSENVTWGPGETRHLPEAYAEWFRSKSLYQLDSVTYQHKYKLVILGKGQDESELLAEELPGKADGIVDWQNRPSGKYKREVVSVNGIPVATPRHDKADLELAEKQAEHAAKVDAAAEKISQFSEEEVAQGLRSLATREDGRVATVRG